MSFNYPWKITIPPLEDPRPRGNLVRTLADGYSTVGLGFKCVKSFLHSRLFYFLIYSLSLIFSLFFLIVLSFPCYLCILGEREINKLRQLNKELQQLRLEILSLLAETSILKEDFLKTKEKEFTRSQKMGDLVLLIGSIYNKYDQNDFESNNTVSYNDPEQDSRSNATLNSKDKDSNGVQKEVDSSGVEEDTNEIQKDSNGDQESPSRSSRVMKNASPYLPSPLWSTIPFYGAVSSLVLNLDKQIHGTDVLISLLQREKTYETRMEIVNLSFSLAQLVDEEDDLLAQVENSGWC